MRVATNVSRRRSVVAKKFKVLAPKQTSHAREDSFSSTSSMSFITIEKECLGESRLCDNKKNKDIYSTK
jgi:hypothetical protein